MIPVAVPLRARVHYMDEIRHRVRRVDKFGAIACYPSSLAYEYAYCSQYVKALEANGKLKGEMKGYVDYDEFVNRFDVLPDESYVYFDPDESEVDEYLELKNKNFARNAAYEVSEEVTETPITSVWLMGRLKWWVVVFLLFYLSYVADFGVILSSLSTVLMVCINCMIVWEVFLLKFPELSRKRRVLNIIGRKDIYVDLVVDPSDGGKVKIVRSRPVYTRERRSKMWLDEMLIDLRGRTTALEDDETNLLDELNNISEEFETLGSSYRLTKHYYELLAKVELIHDAYIEIKLRRK